MFDLNREVDSWSREFAGTKCGRNDRVEELKDHLFCEIEKNIEEGLNPESAFLAATRRFGISEELKAEFQKGVGITPLLCEYGEEPFGLSTKQIAAATGLYLVLFAAFTFGLAYLLRGRTTYEYLTPVLYILSLLPVIFVVSSQKRIKAECAFVKRMWRKVF